MSGAQGKAAVICGAICVIAECDVTASRKRHKQGWVMETEGDINGKFGCNGLTRTLTHACTHKLNTPTSRAVCTSLSFQPSPSV
jgi:hypothetical protein